MVCGSQIWVQLSWVSLGLSEIAFKSVTGAVVSSEGSAEVKGKGIFSLTHI
jgi:hypothetical protein